MKEHEECPPIENRAESHDTADVDIRTGDLSTIIPAVVDIGTRPVVEIGRRPEPIDATTGEPDAEWDRTDDYAMTGYNAYRSDMGDLRDANTEARLRRGDVRFG